MKSKRDLLGARGLILAPPIRHRLNQVGVYAQPAVSLEYQTLAKRYVLRGTESGGALAEMGRYVTFAAENGEPLTYLLPVDTLAPNGLHAVVVAPVLVRVELLRIKRTCQLLVTRHEPESVDPRRRPATQNKLLFRGVDGILASEIWKREHSLADSVEPRFWSKAGEPLEIPSIFLPAVRAATHGACCVGCLHSHYLAKPISSSDAVPVSNAKPGDSRVELSI
jgi:hypothetical protein